MRKSRANEMSMEITVGAFVFMVLLALGVFTIILSTENIFRQSYELTVRFEDVMGLRSGDGVLVRGVSVGKVKALRLERDGVYVDLLLNEPVELKEDYRIETVPSSVLGGRNLQIHEGTLDAPALEAGILAQGEQPIDFIDETSRTIQAVREALEEGGVLENLRVTMEQFRQITTGLSEGQGTLGRLLANDEVYLKLETIADNLGTVSSALAEGQGTIGKLLSDEKVYNDLTAVSGNLREISDRLAKGEGTIGKLLMEDDQLYNNLVETSSSLRNVAAAIENSEGTLGKLTMDDEIYNEVSLLIYEIRATIDDLRETSPITTFSSVFFGAF